MQTFKFLMVLSISILFANSLLSQSLLENVGTVDENHVLNYDHELADGSSAIFIEDQARVFFVFDKDENRFSYIFERYFVLKILDKEGFDYGNLTVDLYKDGEEREKIVNIKAKTHYSDGGELQTQNMGTEAIFQEDVSEHWSVQKFTFPAIREGAVVECFYSVRSPFFSRLPTWQFQRSIPVVKSRLEVEVPEFFSYKILSTGLLNLSENEKEKKMTAFDIPAINDPSSGKYRVKAVRYKWESRDNPAFKDEPYMAAKRDYLGAIRFELATLIFPGGTLQTFMEDWPAFMQTCLKHENLGLQANRRVVSKSELEQIVGNSNEEWDRIQAIYAHVQESIEWDGNFSAFTDRDIKDVYTSKSGNSAAMNLLLYSMLDQAGMTADLVMISTRQHGKVFKAFPVSQNFNHLVVRVKADKEYRMLDATCLPCRAGMLPPYDLNGDGKVLNKKAENWVPLLTEEKYSHILKADYTLQGNGNLQAKTKFSYGSLAAMLPRDFYETEGEEKPFEKVLGDESDWEIESVSHADKGNFYTSEYVLKKGDADEDEADLDRIYFSPFILNSANENPFKSEERRFPVDIGAPIKRMAIFSIAIPEGFKMESGPESVYYTLPEEIGKFKFHVNEMGNTVSVVSTVQLDQPEIDAKYYPSLQKLFAEIEAKHSEPFVFVRDE